MLFYYYLLIFLCLPCKPSLRFEDLPSILTIHLKRFQYDDRTGLYSRVASRVVFPPTLVFPAVALVTAALPPVTAEQQQPPKPCSTSSSNCDSAAAPSAAASAEHSAVAPAAAVHQTASTAAAQTAETDLATARHRRAMQPLPSELSDSADVDKNRTVPVPHESVESCGVQFAAEKQQQPRLPEFDLFGVVVHIGGSVDVRNNSDNNTHRMIDETDGDRKWL